MNEDYKPAIYVPPTIEVAASGVTSVAPDMAAAENDPALPGKPRRSKPAPAVAVQEPAAQEPSTQEPAA